MIRVISASSPERWIDYSGGKLTGSAVLNAGYTGAIRYIDSPGLLGIKHINLTEYRSLTRSVDVRLVMEVNARDANGGYRQGVQYASRAKAGADYFAYNGVIYFTNDQVALASDTLWHDYLYGAASILGWDRVGGYGFANAMDVASHLTPCQHFWQAGRRSDVRPFVQIWQDNNHKDYINGIEVDMNEILIPLETDVVDLNALLDTIITVKSNTEHPATEPDYTEDHTLRYILSNIFFETADTFKRIIDIQEAVAKLSTVGGADVSAVAAQLDALLAKRKGTLTWE